MLVGALLLAAIPALAQDVTQGTLTAFDKDHKPVGECPLQHTDVAVDISGFIARVTLVQDFQNPFPDPIEAVYTFPMSERGAVDRMTMEIGDRVIKGVVKEREEARRIYEAAKQAGQAASLLDQERPNIFTQSVANILPGNTIKITISYVEYLKYEDNTYEFSFPMVVGPRYIPGQPAGQGTTQVPDANRITPPVTPEGTRAGHDISLAVTLDAGLPVTDLKSVLHEVETERPGESRAVVRLKNQQEIPNRDFVLKYGVAGDKIGDAILTHAAAKGGFVTLVLHPPARVAPEEATSKEMIFVIDCSGSMSGFPIEKAKKTMRMCIEQMNPKDTFNLISFAGGTGYCFQGAVPNTPDNQTKALEYLGRLQGGGGTEMMGAVRAALAGPYPEDRLRIVCFMTDGFIGNDMEILAEIQKTRAGARVFSFGIGNGVNRFLLDGMAREGRGASEIVTLESKGDEAAKRFHERIHSPVLTNIQIDFGGLSITDVYPDPKALPDLFSSQPVVLTGRYTGGGQGTITLKGHTASGPFERSIPVTLPAEAPERDVLEPLWARARIDDLMGQDWSGVQSGEPDKKIKEEITRLGIEFSLVTQFTSFVAVEEKVINEGGKTRRVEVPVEMTDGVSYEGVFGKDLNNPAGLSALGYLGSGAKSMARPMSAPPRAMRKISTRAAAESAAVEMDAAAEMPLPEPALKPEPKKGSAAPNPKLDPALHGLAQKLVNGAYQKDNVKVENGWVEVFIQVSDASAETLRQLREAGVDITSVKTSTKTVLAKIKVQDLDQVAKLDCVVKIEPPRF
jgi:Ca-activated chloride channel family protein